MKKAHAATQHATVCLVAPCLVSTTENQMVGIAQAAASTGLKLHIICCSTETSSELQISSLRVSKLATDHGAQVAFTSPGVLPQQEISKLSAEQFELVRCVYMGMT